MEYFAPRRFNFDDQSAQHGPPDATGDAFNGPSFLDVFDCGGVVPGTNLDLGARERYQMGAVSSGGSRLKF